MFQCRALVCTVLTFLMSTAAIGTDAEAQSFAVGRSIETPEHPNAVAIGDFNNDGHQDIVIPCYSPNSVSVALADGTGGFGPAVAYEAGGGPRFAAVADFNGDGHADIVVANQDSADVAVLLGTGAGTFAPTRRVPAGLRPFHLAVSDLNNDGSSDILVANSASHTISILLGDGHGGFSTAGSVPVGTTPQAVVAADFNLDGKLDLAASNYGSNDVWVVHGNGDGSFAGTSIYAVGAAPFTLASADLNSDGRPDLAVPEFQWRDGVPASESGERRICRRDDDSCRAEPTRRDARRPRRRRRLRPGGREPLQQHYLGSSRCWYRRVRGRCAGTASAMDPFFVAALDVNDDGFLDLASLIVTATLSASSSVRHMAHSSLPLQYPRGAVSAVWRLAISTGTATRISSPRTPGRTASRYSWGAATALWLVLRNTRARKPMGGRARRLHRRWPPRHCVSQLRCE